MSDTKKCISCGAELDEKALFCPSCGAKQEEIKIVNNSENVEEAMQALQILGYNKKEIEKAFEKIANTDVSVEELIKKGLSILAR